MNQTRTASEDRYDQLESQEHHSLRTEESLIPQPEPHTTPKHLVILRTYFYKFTSLVCTTAFLLSLFIVSISQQLFNKLFGSKKHPIVTKKAFPLVRGDFEIHDDLKYYANLLGLELHEYTITTDDGFHIELKHLVKPIEQNFMLKPPILLIHGLLQSSASFLTSGEKSLAYHLIENGYDVWLGNNRCGFHPRHQWLTSNDLLMWAWDIVDLATSDIPCFISNILKINTNYTKVSLCCHSQGTTQTFVALSKFYNPSLNDQIQCFIALAPAVFGGPLLDEKFFIRFINFLTPTMYNLFFGILSFMPIMMHARKIIYKSKLFGFLSYAMFHYLFSWDDSLWDPSLRGIHFLFSPVYISTQLMRWWLSSDGFVNSKSILDNKESWYDDNDTPPIKLFIGGKDRLVDGALLIDHLRNHEPTFSNYEYDIINEYAHLDVLWADDVIEKIGNPMLDFLNRVHNEDM